MSETRVTSIKDRSFNVDTSKRACNDFGFDPDDRVKDNASGGALATVIGVAEDPGFGTKALWLIYDKNGGKVSMPRKCTDLVKI